MAYRQKEYNYNDKLTKNQNLLMDKLYKMRMSGMAEAFENQLMNPNSGLESFETRFSEIINHEWFADGMVAMSSNYPFGTQLMINGKLYTVEDRGGSEIENNIHRVDIYVPNHQQALNLGRFKTTATVYRIGR